MTVLGFKGNKRSLPSKACAVCGRQMSWRKRWAKTWNEVKYCSDACRATRPVRARAHERTSEGTAGAAMADQKIVD